MVIDQKYQKVPERGDNTENLKYVIPHLLSNNLSHTGRQSNIWDHRALSFGQGSGHSYDFL